MRLSKYQAVKASRVFPMAMPVAVATGTWVSRFAPKAPSKMAGQKFLPRTSNAAIATPVGGQTGETFV